MSLSINTSSAAKAASAAGYHCKADAKGPSKTPCSEITGKDSQGSFALSQGRASLHLVSRDLSSETSLKPESLSATNSHTTAAQPIRSSETMLPRPDRTVSWADVDSDSEDDASVQGSSHSPSPTMIPPFYREAHTNHQQAEDHSHMSLSDLPAAVAASQGMSTVEPVQTHFGFNLLPLGAVPEDAEVLSTGTAEDASDPNNRVSVLISGGAEDWGKGHPSPARPRQHGYAGVLTMLHRSVSADAADAAEPAANGLPLTAARIEAVLPVGVDEWVCFCTPLSSAFLKLHPLPLFFGNLLIVLWKHTVVLAVQVDCLDVNPVPFFLT